MQNILISACLLGVNCRYNGKSSTPIEELSRLKEKFHLIPVCPEIYGGLPTPREASERCGDRICMRTGQDVTEQFLRGAKVALQYAELFECKKAILKERSPSCGSGLIYDGTFSGVLKDGLGVTAELLLRNGIQVYGESEISVLLSD